MKKKANKIIEVRFIGFVRSVIQRPALFEVNKIEDMSLIILGFHSGLDHEDQNVIFNFLQNFKKFVRGHFNFEEESTWQRLIRFYSGGDQSSLFLFDKLFEEFIEKNYKSSAM
jgi:hypothetical protein